MILNKILSFAASIIKFIIVILFTSICNAEQNNIKYYSDEMGALSIMYHRFDEKKYPSTNIQMEIFKKHIEIINSNNLKFVNPKEFRDNFDSTKNEKKYF